MEQLVYQSPRKRTESNLLAVMDNEAKKLTEKIDRGSTAVGDVKDEHCTLKFEFHPQKPRENSRSDE